MPYRATNIATPSQPALNQIEHNTMDRPARIHSNDQPSESKPASKLNPTKSSQNRQNRAKPRTGRNQRSQTKQKHQAYPGQAPPNKSKLNRAMSNRTVNDRTPPIAGPTSPTKPKQDQIAGSNRIKPKPTQTNSTQLSKLT